MENTAIVQSVNADCLQSRWGHYPCNRETFLKLKRLHKAFWIHLRRYVANERWNAKTVYRHGTAPEYCPLFEVRKQWACINGVSGMFRRTEEHPVRKLFQQARRPSVEPVKAFDAAALQQIDDWLTTLGKWEQEH